MRFTGGNPRPSIEVADLAEKLGLDPAQTTEVSVELLPSGAAVMHWSGVRELTEYERDQLVMNFVIRGG